MGRTYWHSAICGATEWELKQNKDDLEFESEHILNKEPIKMDMLVIKKHPNATIRNEIGRIFRGHNVLEFKGSGDALNVDVYHKVIGYACLYKSMGSHVNERDAKDITVTMIREAYPRELIKSLKMTGITVTEQYPGIYYLSGNIMFPTQIIVTGRLSSDHASLRILSKKAQEADVRKFLQEARTAVEPGDLRNIDAVLQVSVSENETLYNMVREDKIMCQALENLMQDVIEERVEERIEKRVEERQEQQTVKNLKAMMKNLKLTAEQALQALDISDSDKPRYMAML
ncbi:MAG: hypothetical protein IJ058_11435 [Lachnospiraceae bacterium]|nr:hypothetical protein [Lachnospiraceae bacterium]